VAGDIVLATLPDTLRPALVAARRGSGGSESVLSQTVLSQTVLSQTVFVTDVEK